MKENTGLTRGRTRSKLSSRVQAESWNMALAIVLFSSLFCVNSAMITVSLNRFVQLKCPSENHGFYGQDSVIQCSVTSRYPHVRILQLAWRKFPTAVFSFVGWKSPEEARIRFAKSGRDQSSTKVSLLVEKTQMSDEGQYDILVVTDHGTARNITSLKVTARYTALTMRSVPEDNIQEDSTVTMFCHALGGYPAGTIRWFDQYGTDWTRSAETEVTETADKRFDITSTFSVRRASSSSPGYGCSIFDASGAVEREAELLLAFATPAQKVSAGWSKKGMAAMTVVVGSLTCGLLVLMLFQRRRRRQSHLYEEDIRVMEGSDQMEAKNVESSKTPSDLNENSLRPVT